MEMIRLEIRKLLPPGEISYGVSYYAHLLMTLKTSLSFIIQLVLFETIWIRWKSNKI